MTWLGRTNGLVPVREYIHPQGEMKARTDGVLTESSEKEKGIFSREEEKRKMVKNRKKKKQNTRTKIMKREKQVAKHLASLNSE